MATQSYSCTLCSYTTQRKYNYDRHINMVHNSSLVIEEPAPDNKVKCPDCYKSFTNIRNLNCHKPICNKKQHPNQCIDCKKIYSDSSSLAFHRKKHVY